MIHRIARSLIAPYIKVTNQGKSHRTIAVPCVEPPTRVNAIAPYKFPLRFSHNTIIVMGKERLQQKMEVLQCSCLRTASVRMER